MQPDECLVCFKDLTRDNAIRLIPCGHARDCCIGCSRLLNVCPRCQQSLKFLAKLTFETVHKHSISIICDLRYTTRQVCEIIAANHRQELLQGFRCPIAEIMMLVYSGRVLSSDRALADYPIEDGSKLFVLENLRGD